MCKSKIMYSLSSEARAGVFISISISISAYAWASRWRFFFVPFCFGMLIFSNMLHHINSFMFFFVVKYSAIFLCFLLLVFLVSKFLFYKAGMVLRCCWWLSNIILVIFVAVFENFPRLFDKLSCFRQVAETASEFMNALQSRPCWFSNWFANDAAIFTKCR